MGLVITRKVGTGIRIITEDGSVDINVTALSSKRVKLGVTGSKNYPLHRVDVNGELELRTKAPEQDKEKNFNE
jgi:sRNA-binding carbon storage regulator CsrA